MSQSDFRTCRFCFDDAVPEKMVSPCNCKGTTTYVHRHCLSTWVETSGKKICDVCKSEYQRQRIGFKPLSQWSFPEGLFIVNADNIRWERIYALSYGIFSEIFILRLIRNRGSTAMLQLAVPAISLSWWVAFFASIVYYGPIITDCITEEYGVIKDAIEANVVYEWVDKPKN